jgi:hypothetical protein
MFIDGVKSSAAARRMRMDRRVKEKIRVHLRPFAPVYV